MVRTCVFDLPLLVVSCASETLVTVARNSPKKIAIPEIFICLLSSLSVEDTTDLRN